MPAKPCLLKHTCMHAYWQEAPPASWTSKALTRKGACKAECACSQAGGYAAPSGATACPDPGLGAQGNLRNTAGHQLSACSTMHTASTSLIQGWSLMPPSQLQTSLRHHQPTHLQERLLEVVRRQGLCAASAALAAQGRVGALVEAVLILPSPAAALLLGSWRVPAGSCSVLGWAAENNPLGGTFGSSNKGSWGSTQVLAAHVMQRHAGAALSSVARWGLARAAGCQAHAALPSRQPNHLPDRVRIISLPSVHPIGDCMTSHQAAHGTHIPVDSC